MISKLYTSDELDSLRGLVAELGTALGCAREWDVFVTQILPAVQNQPGAQAGQKAFVRKSEERRQHYHQLVQAALQTGKLQRLLLRFGAWMNGNYWHGIDYGHDLPHFAGKVLRQYKLKVNRYSGHVHQDSDASQLHVLRIACKNLRYSVELFSSLYEAKKTKRYLAALMKLQETLGELNDHAVAIRLLAEMEQDALPKTAALIRAGIEQGHSKRLSKLRKAWQHFAALPDFWT
jgi:CHAD domain-containing protein